MPGFPFDELDRFYTVHVAQKPRHGHGCACPPGYRLERLSDCWTLADMALDVGQNHRTVIQWSTRNAVPVRRADDVATALGWHPSLVWSNWESVEDARCGVA